ncbi:kinesin-related protein 4-like [Pieris brassicae]|uniref:kinesin-related protein 4-like n=1 Tax=Pieris brassicae TaxID=7116 RepID=UPI001E66021A|nr:kinesin-related protein 4-like [Pieris brassicae]
MSDNIKVVVKVRPLIPREIEDKLFYQWRVKNTTLYQIDQNGKDCGQNFTFDNVYDKDAKTSEVYNDIAKPIVEAAIAGINGTIFAYGQTSSGKTHTMTGTDDSPGIIHLAVLNLFDLIRKIPDRDFLLRVSFVEIYNETLIDLLDVTKNIKICDTHNGVKVDTTEKVTASPGEVLEFMKQGEANRQTASTNMNDKSSRSHSIFQITIESREHTEDEEEVGSVNISQLNLVDLAGSERAGQTGATGIRFKEGTHINKSLSVLALVIKQLSEGQNKHVSYRDSKLTRILQNSLGGNAKTSIICAVTPAVVEETISTLQFACRAKAIKNRPEVNAVATSSSMIQNLTKQLCALKTALENKRNVEQDNCNLQKQIAHLQKLILNGFHQRSSSDLISGAKRKLCPPRRMTISTLHPIQEDPTPSIPKFCTPSLKYNAFLIPGGSDFAPISSASLSCLTEEPARAITPPFRDKKVNFNEEIIELDSDDDTPTDVQTCSPYHNCYDSSKTPPCVMRRNYKEAEKKYKEIVKFTEIEKIYPPDTIDLIKKLEEKTLALFKVEESLNTLTDVCNEKDKHIEQLQATITQAELELKNITTAKSDLDAHCVQYQTQLTDWEVSYDTLMKKSKNREKELLSLLEEHSTKKENGKEKEMKETGTMYSPLKSQHQNDLYCVCRNTESDSSESDLASKQIRDMAAELEAQIVLKDQTIIELQATISAHKHNIETLENVNRETKEMLAGYRQNVLLKESENDILKSKISDLNSLVESQKSEINTFNSDIDSYNTVMQDFQEKLLHKNKLLISNSIVDDKDIEALIAMEESFIANNENIRNIINSLKNILHNKNEEIEKLKASLTNEEQSCKDTNNYHEEIKIIKKELEENQNTNTKYLIEIEKLKEQNGDLISTISTLEEKYTVQEEIFKSKTIQLESEIKTLEETIQSKENIISSFINENNKTQEDLNLAKLTLNKLRDVITLLSGNIEGIPDMLDDFASVFKVFGDNLNTLECVVQNGIEDKKCLQELINKHEKEIIKLHEALENASEIVDSASKDFIGCIQNSSVADKENAKFKLASKIKTLLDEVKYMQDNYLQNINSKDTEINNLRSDIIVTVSKLNDKSKELECKSQELQAVLVGHDKILHGVVNKIMDLVLELKIENTSFEGLKSTTSPELIYDYINKLASEIRTIQAKNESNNSNTLQVIADATAKIKQLNEENLKLSNALSQVKKENSTLCEEIVSIKTNKEDIIVNLTTSNKALGKLQNDLEAKSSEIDVLQNKALEWKEQFLNLDTTMKEELDKLEFENSQLKRELERLSSNESIVVEKSNFNVVNKAQENSEDVLDLKSPPSLLTICCDTILDAIQPSENETSACPSTSNTSLCDSKVQLSCRCDQLQSKVEILQIENDNFKMSLHNLQDYNESLVLELEEAKGELLLLLDLTHELQRKIVNHRTNLSTLTATTYAENISLSSQLRSLQHYHSLFYKACEKDIPEVKKELQELMALLKTGNALPNESCRRYSLPTALENSAIQPSKCESMLDGDLLMLDTNITLTTCDNTLTGHEQSCFDATQSSIDVGCQTNNCSEITEIQNPSIHEDTTRKILQNVETLKLENHKLREIVEEYELIKQNKLKYVDSQCSPIKLVNFIKDCEKCLELQDSIKIHSDIFNENDTLRRQLAEITSLKDDLEAKYKTSVAELASTEALFTKLKNFEKDLSTKSHEISKLTSLINTKNKELDKLQEENDSLSNQVIDNIYENETLKKEIDSLKQNNLEVSQKHAKLQEAYDILDDEHFNSPDFQDKCQECIKKDDIIKSLQSTVSVSRYNKICTLQSELHAGKEDCNELKNEVTNIKNHLDKSNISIVQAMDLDESIGDSNLLSLKKCDIDNKFNMPDLPKERPLDIYTLDKVDCVNYCIENTGLDEESFTCDMKIIDVMKLLYTNILTKHNNEIENLVNKLKDFEESKLALQTEFNNLIHNQEKIQKEINEKNVYLQAMVNVVANIKNNLSGINKAINESELSEVLDLYKNSFFKFIDKELSLSSLETFDCILNLIDEKHRLEMLKLSEGNNSHQTISENLIMLNKELETARSDLLNKEKEYNLLRLHNEKIFEINNCVTLNIVKKEKFLHDTTNEIYQDLVSKNLINKEIINGSMPFNEIIPIMFKCATQHQQSINEENTKLTLEINTMKVSLDEKNREIDILQEEMSKVSKINAQFSEALNDKEAQLKEQISVHDILKCTYDKKVEENNTNLIIITNLTDQINIIKETIKQKDFDLQALQSQLHSQQQNSQIAEVVKELQKYKEDIDKLNSLNNILSQEKESASVELQKANDIIKQNKLDLDKITSDMLILKEAVDQSSNDMESLRIQSTTLLDQNKLLKEEIKEKTKEFSRLETNIKTYQKSAEFQCKMISRLKKEKADIEKSNIEYIEKLSEWKALLDELKSKDALHAEEVNTLKNIKASLENRISELEKDQSKRISNDVKGNKSRRQSLYDSHRTFSENDDDPKKVEALFGSRKCDDLFMDVDEGSNRSTPIRFSKGRDSLASSRHEQSEEEGSRASSVQASRRRRQSIHDAYRGALDTSRRHSVDRNNDSLGSDSGSEVSKLRKQLTVCQEELEEWKEKFREVDEECEICAQYLRERDEQCRQLKVDKRSLEITIEELKVKVQGVNVSKTSSVDIAVNTEEDWANLHSVVVDRMSYDAEVEKNKKLSRTIEDLRYQKQELTNTLTRMQKSIEKKTTKDRDLEAIRSELKSCQRELDEVKVRNRELDEECETCSEYLKERDEQIKKLKEAKKALEIKLMDYEDSSICLSVRKKRQTLHDHNRQSNGELVDAATETCADLNVQPERGENSKEAEMYSKEFKRLKFTVEKLTQQKVTLEQQVAAMTASTPLYVSTGSSIVQQQQFSDVIKENQKLKTLNAKLTKICRKMKSQNTNRENEDPADEINM